MEPWLEAWPERRGKGMTLLRASAISVVLLLLGVISCSNSGTTRPAGESTPGMGGNEGTGGATQPGEGGGGPAQGGDAGDNQGGQGVGGSSQGGSAGNNQGGVDGLGGAPPSPTTIVSATGNLIDTTACGAIPATVEGVPAGSHTVQLGVSTLSKGTVDTEPHLPAVDNYVVVHLPFGDSSNDEHRYLMLNGVGATYSFELDQPGTIEAWFIDADPSGNNGTAAVLVEPGGFQITVDAAVNVLAWRTVCKAEAATLWAPAGEHELTLESSTLSSAPGRKDDYVILRFPSEIPEDDHRYVMLNGVGATFRASIGNGDWIRAWFISSSTGTSGEATVRISGK